MMRANTHSNFWRGIICALLFLALVPVSQLTIAQANAKRIALSQPLTLRWKYESDLTLSLTPAFVDDSLFVPLSGGTLISLRASDGRLRWRAEVGGELSASPAADSDSVYVATEILGEPTKSSRRATGTLRALGNEGGVTLWMRTLARPLRGTLTVAGRKILAGGSDGKFYAFDKNNGQALWVFDHSAAFNGQAVASATRVYIGGEDGTLLAIDVNSGKLVWRYRSRGPVRGPVALAADTVYFGSGDSYVYALNADTGKLRWRTRTGAGVQAVAAVSDALLVASLDNFVYQFSLNGTRLWKRRLPGRVASQPLTTGDCALFTPLSSSTAIVLGLNDGRPVNSLPTDEQMTPAAPIGVGDAVVLTTERALLAFAQPKERTESK